MAKRSAAYPSRTSKGEQRINSHKHYTEIVKNPSYVKPVWLQDNYGVVKTEVAK